MREALGWLRINNPLYRSIEVDETAFLELEAFERAEQDDPKLVISPLEKGVEDADSADNAAGTNLSSNLAADVMFSNGGEDEPESVESVDMALQHSLRQPTGCTIDLPPCDQKVPDFVGEEKFPFIVAAFPWLFPFGCGDVSKKRVVPLSLGEYFRTLVLQRKRRFGSDAPFILYATNKLQREQALSSVRFALRQEGKNTQVRDLRTAAVGGDWTSGVLSQLTPYFVGVRGTSLYWKTKQRNLLAMVENMNKPPTFFATFSAGDSIWPELLSRVRRENALPVPNDESQMRQARLACLSENPILAALLFHERWRALNRHILRGRCKPIGCITDHWCRIEFQRRGSPHLHCMFWIKGAPDALESFKSVVAQQDLNAWLETKIQADVAGMLSWS
jgi:hypothetical protein